LDVVTIL